MNSPRPITDFVGRGRMSFCVSAGCPKACPAAEGRTFDVSDHHQSTPLHTDVTQFAAGQTAVRLTHLFVSLKFLNHHLK